LTEIVIGMVNIDITKHDVIDIHTKVYDMHEVFYNHAYRNNFIKGGIMYSTFFIGDSLVFTASKLNT